MKMRCLGRRAVILAGCAAALWFSQPAAAREALTLDQAIATALKNNPSIAAASSEVEAAGARVTQAEADRYPQVNASAGYDHTWNDPHTKTPAARSEVDSYSTGVSVSQTIYDFGQTSASIDRSKNSLAAAKSGLKTETRTLIRDVKSAFYEALKRKGLVEVRQEALDAKARQLEQARALYKEGMRPGIDVTRSEVDRSKAKLNLQSAQYDLKRGMTALDQLLGGRSVAGDYELAEDRAPAPTAADLDSLVDIALKSRSELAELRAQVQAAEAGNRLDRRTYWPTLDARGSYAYSGEEFPMDRRWQAGVTLSVPIFSGFRKTGQVAESDAEIRRLTALFDQRVLAVTEEVTQAFLEVREVEDAIATAETVLKQARENLAQAEGRYKAGVSDAIELSDAQLLYTEARSDLVQAVYDQHKAWAVLEFAAGGNLK